MDTRERIDGGRAQGRRRAVALFVAVAVLAGGCATTTAGQWHPAPVAGRISQSDSIAVMAPIWQATASGNFGHDIRLTSRDVLTRILTIVRDQSPGATIAETGPRADLQDVPGWYRDATGEPIVTREEFDAATRAAAHGATHLLVPTVVEWTEMRTDDPIGAFVLPHNRVTLTLRLMRLQPPALAGRATFHNRARLTLNQRAVRLLNNRFRTVVLDLLAGA